MEEKNMRVTLFISAELSPKTIKWLEAGPNRLRASRLLQYLEMNLTADENGGMLRPTRSDIGFSANICSSNGSAKQLLTPQLGSGLGVEGISSTNAKKMEHEKPSVIFMESIADQLGEYAS